ncbi:hypothetical protein Zmor_004047 [Zophobas morio]|uniref:Heat shock protein 70 n=1 Tax=Zophobas morio TaxID=2755281 RepID=A0AA38HM94_9CUCU|nr:hypothetical protein Zmor_004047 [Zophobas morio]
MEDLVIGIDLGTTNCCVSLYRNGNSKVLENDSGDRLTPSFVFYTNLGVPTVGKHARQQAESNPENGIYVIKRLIGKKYDEASIQHKLNSLPFQMEFNSSYDPIIVIKQGNQIIKKSPQELCSIILQKLKNDVEKKMGVEVNKVIITVPAYFNVLQREATLAAAQSAGFTVLKLLNEPTAAALTYYNEKDTSETNYSLVYDLGGGTFDVAILKRKGHDIEIICVNGDTNLGGQDIDNLLIDYISDKLRKSYNFEAKEKDEHCILRNKCEEAKKSLSFFEEITITLIGLVENQRKVEIHLKREELETIADDLFQRTIQIVDECVKTSKIPKNSIDEVILSGGSTRIPKIQTVLSDYFEKKKLNTFVNPDECVAEGAAIQAAMVSKNPEQSITKIQMSEVIPLSIGTGDQVGRMRFLINRNTPIPAFGTVTLNTAKRNQTSALINVYEGERTNVQDNRFLGKMTIENLTPAPPRHCTVNISVNVDENGILRVSAQEVKQHGENSKEIKINYVRGNRSQGEIKNTLTDAEECKDKDECFIRFAEKKRYLINYCESYLYNLIAKNIIDKYRNIYESCKETKKKVKLLNLEEENVIEKLIINTRMQCEEIAKEHNFEFMPKSINVTTDLSDDFLRNLNLNN